jgi:hypothetical protein
MKGPKGLQGLQGQVQFAFVLAVSVDTISP